MSKPKQQYYRHGDLCLIKVDKVPDDFLRHITSPKSHTRGVIIAEGEKTGHHHTLEKVETYYDFEFNGNRISFVEIKEPTKLDHEEHGELTIEPGIYQVNFQKELDMGTLSNVPINDSETALRTATRQVID